MKKIALLALTATAIGLALTSDGAQAYERHLNHHSYIDSRPITRLPWGYRPFRHRGSIYYFNLGTFYQKTPRGYILVDAPTGYIVRDLPAGCVRRYHNDNVYYVYNDTYYSPVSGGYQVVEAPIQAQYVQSYTQNSSITPRNVATGPDKLPEEYEIYIPNKNGSFTLVVIRKADKGFIGPQGEYYKEHPTVEQLKMMYAKN